ncbi:hypothetical protein J0910_00465 [Nocardiopsis sp. CNT-189]|uniref:DUF6248 family natural product biosynthesis protein n=1 Tax=Nocardiopsis oceanisediminis TaxID=2816862 RepID=UPI003B2E49E2
MTAPARPQRVLTEKELEVVCGIDLLTLHKCLLLGIVDPVPNLSPMSEDEGAWVREHVFSPHHRFVERGYPWGFWRWSYCEKGTCWNCLSDRCDICVHRQQGRPDVCDNTDHLLAFDGRALAQVIRRPDGRPCAWVCRCPCPKTGPAPPPPWKRKAAPADAVRPRRPPARPDMDPLFELEAS